MANLNTDQTPIKRGGFAKDRRTGAVVKVAEKGGRDWMVKPAYKSDGYWTAPENLVPVKNPYTWTGGHFVRFVLVILIASAMAYGAWSKMTGHGVGGEDAFWNAALPTGLVGFFAFNYLFNLTRV
jgi:hypothetical protein